MVLSVTAVTPTQIGSEGGHLLTVTGDFSDLLGTYLEVYVGPTGDATDSICYSGRSDDPTKIKPRSETELRCFSPLLATGTHKIFVRDPVVPANNDVLVAAVTVFPRGYMTTVHGTRRIMPPSWRVGPRGIDDERVVASSEPPDVQPGTLRAVIDAVSEADNEIGGLYQTRVRTATNRLKALGPPYTWDGTTTVLTPDTSDVVVGDYIQLDEDGQPFEITVINPSVDVTIVAGGLTIPTGPIATALSATLTWGGTTTITTSDTSEVGVGSWLRLDADGQWFEVESLVTDTSVTITNPFSLTIPSGATQSSRTLNAVTSVVRDYLPVETLAGWSASGTVVVQGATYAYGSVDVTPSLLGITHVKEGVVTPGLLRDHALGATVTDASRARTALDDVRRALLTAYAEETDLDAVGRNLGVLRHSFLVDDDVFRAVIQALAYNPRGTVYGIELLLDALVGVGNYVIFEDIENFPGKVFITLTGGDFDLAGSQGKAYLTENEYQQPASDTTLTIEESVITDGVVHGVTWRDEDHLSDFREAKPSVETLVEYEGDGGTTLWTYDGPSEAADVTVLGSGLEDGSIEISDTSAVDVARYEHIARVQPGSYVAANVITYFDSGSTFHASRHTQWGVELHDGSEIVAWGSAANGADIDIGLTEGADAFVDGVAATLSADVYYAIEVRKYGTDYVELLLDGRVIQIAAYSKFSTGTSETAVKIGSHNLLQASHVARLKQCGYFARTATDYWGAGGAAADLVGANPTRIDVNIAAFFTAADIGKRLTIRNATVPHVPQGGTANGDYLVDSIVVDPGPEVELAGEEFVGATVNADGNDKRVRLDPDGQQFRYPDDLGKTLVISDSSLSNDGPYEIDTLLDPDTLVDLESFATPGFPQFTDVCEVTSSPPFATETDLTYRIDPDVETEGTVEWELSDAGSLSGTTLTLRQSLPIGSADANRVLNARYSQLLSAQLLLDVTVENDPADTWFPFYFSDPLALIRFYLDDVTAAGVLPEYREA